jgi:hypothetical protein
MSLILNFVEICNVWGVYKESPTDRKMWFPHKASFFSRKECLINGHCNFFKFYFLVYYSRYGCYVGSSCFSPKIQCFGDLIWFHHRVRTLLDIWARYTVSEWKCPILNRIIVTGLDKVVQLSRKLRVWWWQELQLSKHCHWINTRWMTMQKIVKCKRGIVFPLRLMKAYMMSGGIAPLIFKPGSRWRWIVSLTLRPLYPSVLPGTYRTCYSYCKNCHWYECRSVKADGTVTLVAKLTSFSTVSPKGICLMLSSFPWNLRPTCKTRTALTVSDR